jgi:hypothetical protein
MVRILLATPVALLVLIVTFVLMDRILAQDSLPAARIPEPTMEATATSTRAPRATATRPIAETPASVALATPPTSTPRMSTPTAVPVEPTTPPAPTATPVPPTPVPPTPVPPTPTAQPAPPTATPTAPVPTATAQIASVVPADDVEALLRAVATAEAQLSSGRIEATVDYGAGTQATTTLAFDLGDGDHEARLYMRTTYTSPSETRLTERFATGDHTWERTAGGAWIAVENLEGIWGQVHAYLPRADTVPAQQVRLDGPGRLRWRDEGRQADVSLRVDVVTGAPREIRRVTAATGAVLTVTYLEWNSDIVIQTPDGLP